MFTTREGMPRQMSSFVNVQRQFFESFVGQTFKEWIRKTFTIHSTIHFETKIRHKKFHCFRIIPFQKNVKGIQKRNCLIEFNIQFYKRNNV